MQFCITSSTILVIWKLIIFRLTETISINECNIKLIVGHSNSNNLWYLIFVLFFQLWVKGIHLFPSRCERFKFVSTPRDDSSEGLFPEWRNNNISNVVQLFSLEVLTRQCLAVGKGNERGSIRYYELKSK